MLVAVAQPARAQGVERSMVPIMTDAVSVLREIENNRFEVVRMELDLVSSTKSTLRELHQGWNYGLVAFGDYRIADIDVVVHKFIGGQWVEIQRDESTARRAAVEITPAYTGTYKIDVRVYSFQPGYNVGHYGLVVFHE
jgi:hypothetical protein